MKSIFLGIILGLSTLIMASESEHSHKHHIDVFVGSTHETNVNERNYDKNNQGFALGLGYQYHLNESWGLGAEIEVVGHKDTVRELLIVVPVTYHLNHEWNVFAGPGYEDGGHHGAYLARVGIAYDYELGNDFNLEPKFMADFIEGGRTTWVAGLALGYSF